MRRVHLVAVWLWGCVPLLLVYRWIRAGALLGWFGAALVAFTVLWWAAALGLLGRRRWAPGLSALLSAMLLLLGLAQSVRRVHFLVDRGGFEAVGGQGSPVAFLVGWGEEAMLLLIPGLVLTVLGVREWTERSTIPSGTNSTTEGKAKA